MADPSAEHWYPTAAYLYVLHWTAPRWRGNTCAVTPTTAATGYAVADDRTRRRLGACACWKTRPGCARCASGWFPDHDAVVQVYPDDDPPPEAHAFEFWRVPGRKQLIHDGKRLVLVSHWPGCCLRLALASGTEDGMAYLYATRACATPCARYRTLAAELDALAVATVAAPAAAARSRPTTAAVLELHTLQALDATWRARPCAKSLKGCSARMPSPPTGTRTAPCVLACGGWYVVAMR